MNIKDRQRWVKLIEEQFSDRRSALRELDRSQQSEAVESWISAKLTAMKLTAKVKKIKAVKQSLQKLEQSLSAEVKQKLGIAVNDEDCGCHESAERILTQYATKQLQNERSEKLAKLGTAERHLLAQVQLAETSDDIEKIAKEAGLL